MSPSHVIFFEASHRPSDHMISLGPPIGQPFITTKLRVGRVGGGGGRGGGGGNKKMGGGGGGGFFFFLKNPWEGGGRGGGGATVEGHRQVSRERVL